jgi:aspartyl protease family protein
MYLAAGSINGYTIDFLVDTGATTVAMNSTTAKRLGISYRLEGRPGIVETASGQEKVYRVMLDTVTVGSIRLRNIPAMVLEGGMPRQVLLGMSFLRQLDIERKGTALMLKQKW